MNHSTFFKQLVTTCSQLFHFWEPSPKLEFKIHFIDSLRSKDILTLEEAAHYLRIEPETLLKEVIEGHIPGGRLAGQWCFSKEVLMQHFSIYHGSAPDDLTEYYEDFCKDDENKVCELEAVQELLDAYARGERNFSGSDLRGALLSNVSLPEIDLVESYLMNIDLSGSNLRKAEFQLAKLQGANFSGADLSYANLSGVDLSGADLSNTILISTNLQQTKLQGANLSGALIQSALF